MQTPPLPGAERTDTRTLPRSKLISDGLLLIVAGVVGGALVAIVVGR